MHRKEQNNVLTSIGFSSKTRIVYCLDNKKSLCYLRAIQGHSGGVRTRPEMMEYTLILYNWMEGVFLSQRNFVDFSIHFGSGLISGEKENDKARQAVFFTPLGPFGNDPDEEEPHDGSVNPACVMNAFRYSVPDGRVVELNVPTLADWTQQHPDGLVGTRVSLATPAAAARCADREDSGQGATVPGSTQEMTLKASTWEWRLMAPATTTIRGPSLGPRAL